MRTGLRLLALGVLVVSLALWFFGGMNLGWTKTSVQVPYRDEVTELTSNVWERRFLPGVDFLGAALAGSAGLVAVSFLFAKK